MSVFKEIRELGKMLFLPISDNDDIEMYESSYFPFDGYAYLMWCGRVVYRKDKKYLAVMNDVDKNHESIHMNQARDCGSWFKFYLSYLWNWIINNPFSKRAYYLSKYEVEAYAKEDDLTYRHRREPNNVEKFKLKNGRDLFNSVGWPYLFVRKIKDMFANI